MNGLIKLALVTGLVVAQSCDSAKKVTNTESAKIEETKVMNEKLISDGYSIGVIEYKGDVEEVCSCTILDKKTNTKLDPINIQDKKFDRFKNKSS